MNHTKNCNCIKQTVSRLRPSAVGLQSIDCLSIVASYLEQPILARLICKPLTKRYLQQLFNEKFYDLIVNQKKYLKCINYHDILLDPYYVKNEIKLLLNYIIKFKNNNPQYNKRKFASAISRHTAQETKIIYLANYHHIFKYMNPPRMQIQDINIQCQNNRIEFKTYTKIFNICELCDIQPFLTKEQREQYILDMKICTGFLLYALKKPEEFNFYTYAHNPISKQFRNFLLYMLHACDKQFPHVKFDDYISV